MGDCYEPLIKIWSFVKTLVVTEFGAHNRMEYSVWLTKAEPSITRYINMSLDTNLKPKKIKIDVVIDIGFLGFFVLTITK